MTATLSPGTVLQNRYTIARLLGRGGMGAVYQATDQRLGIMCAIKETLYTDRAALIQFEREARLLATLKHANLPRVTDYFSEGRRYYLVMDYVPGLNVCEWVRQHGIPAKEQFLLWADQLLDALDYLHTRQPSVIHRDIKPDNIRITPQGTAMLVDFGIAKLYRPSEMTTMGAKAVSPGYSPPEQYSHDVRTDARSDLYSLGATFYFLLTKLPPREATSRLAGMALSPPSRYQPVPQRLESAIMRALALDRVDRWPDAQAFRSALPGVRKTRTRPSTHTPVISLPKRMFRRLKTVNLPQWLLTVFLGVVIVVVLAASVLLLSNLTGSSTAGSEPSATPLPETLETISVTSAATNVPATPLVSATDIEQTEHILPTSTPMGGTADAPAAGGAATMINEVTSVPTLKPQTTSACQPVMPVLLEPAQDASHPSGFAVSFRWEGGQLCENQVWQVTFNGLTLCPPTGAQEVICPVPVQPGEYEWRVQVLSGDALLSDMTSESRRIIVVAPAGSDLPATEEPEPVQPTRTR